MMEDGPIAKAAYVASKRDSELSTFTADAICMIAQHIAKTDAGGKRLLKDLAAMVPGDLGAETTHLRNLLTPPG